eukprot:2225302-Rhodomonas_salina.2
MALVVVLSGAMRLRVMATARPCSGSANPTLPPTPACPKHPAPCFRGYSENPCPNRADPA